MSVPRPRRTGNAGIKCWRLSPTPPKPPADPAAAAAAETADPKGYVAMPWPPAREELRQVLAALLPYPHLVEELRHALRAADAAARRRGRKGGRP